MCKKLRVSPQPVVLKHYKWVQPPCCFITHPAACFALKLHFSFTSRILQLSTLPFHWLLSPFILCFPPRLATFSTILQTIPLFFSILFDVTLPPPTLFISYSPYLPTDIIFPHTHLLNLFLVLLCSCTYPPPPSHVLLTNSFSPESKASYWSSTPSTGVIYNLVHLAIITFLKLFHPHFVRMS